MQDIHSNQQVCVRQNKLVHAVCFACVHRRRACRRASASRRPPIQTCRPSAHNNDNNDSMQETLAQTQYNNCANGKHLFCTRTSSSPMLLRPPCAAAFCCRPGGGIYRNQASKRTTISTCSQTKQASTAGGTTTYIGFGAHKVDEHVRRVDRVVVQQLDDPHRELDARALDALGAARVERLWRALRDAGEHHEQLRLL